jgi:hypothetical protein
MSANGTPPAANAGTDHDADDMSPATDGRNMDEVAERVVDDARRMAEDFYWEWEAKDEDRRTEQVRTKLLCGISIDGALSLMRAWRNCKCVPAIESETDERWRFMVSFIDYETNTTTSRLYVQTKRKPPAGFDPERWEARQFQNGQSRAIRTAIEKSMPTWLVKRGIEAAKEAAVDALSSEKRLKREREEIVSRAKELGLTSTQLKSKTSKSVGAYSPEDVVTMRALLNAIEDGEATIEQMFGAAAARATTAGKPAAQQRGRKAKPKEEPPKDPPKDAPKSGTKSKDSKADREALVAKLGRALTKAKDEQELEFAVTDVTENEKDGKLSKADVSALNEATTLSHKRLKEAAKTA